jgi:serine O-acetyltransferase
MLRKLFFAARALPCFILYRLSPRRDIVDEDIAHWRVRRMVAATGAKAFFVLMKEPEFRNLINYRIPSCRKVSWLVGAEAPALYINTAEIAPGFYIDHGFATIISARSIGRNCSINQQVTIGFNGYGQDDCPTIGDNVSINAGAKLLGKITIGNNVIIGAGAVVVKSIPADCTVVGVPAYIVRRNGASCRENL